jgi:hypothetical protein
MLQRILALVAGFLVVATIGGWGHEHRSGRAEQPQAARAIRAVTSDRADAASRLPADFTAVMGYRPDVAGVGPTRADGGCSSPFGGTPWRFSPDCKRHDLGYDLLRYADAKGQPLGPWARKAVDNRFARQTRAHCHGLALGSRLGCRAMAGLYRGMVGFNSWRQGYGAPVVEPVRALALPVLPGLGTAFLLGRLPKPRRRDGGLA